MATPAPPPELARRGPGRPARIGQQDIVEAALELGLDSFSMQGIARHLGVTTPALYSHVSGRDEVVALVRTVLSTRLRTFTSPARDWRAWLVDFGRLVRRHSTSARALLGDGRAPSDFDRVGIGEQGLRLLIDAGCTPAEAGYALWLVFRVAVTAGPAEGAALSGFVGDTGHALGRRSPSGFPAVGAVNRALASERSHDTFDFDLAVVLDGIEARLVAATAAGRCDRRVRLGLPTGPGR